MQDSQDINQCQLHTLKEGEPVPPGCAPVPLGFGPNWKPVPRLADGRDGIVGVFEALLLLLLVVTVIGTEVEGKPGRTGADMVVVVVVSPGLFLQMRDSKQEIPRGRSQMQNQNTEFIHSHHTFHTRHQIWRDSSCSHRHSSRRHHHSHRRGSVTGLEGGAAP